MPYRCHDYNLPACNEQYGHLEKVVLTDNRFSLLDSVRLESTLTARKSVGPVKDSFQNRRRIGFSDSENRPEEKYWILSDREIRLAANGVSFRNRTFEKDQFENQDSVA
jgi:hypothetical protein